MKDNELKQLIKEEIKLVLEDKRAEIDSIVKLDHALLGAKQVSLRNGDLKERFYQKIVALQTEIDEYLAQYHNNAQSTTLNTLQSTTNSWK